jgi:Family of unknown function (DUF6069)
MFSKRLTWKRLWRIGLLTIVASLVANLTLRMVGIAIFHIPSAFAPLGIGPVVFWTVVMAVGAILVFALIGRISQNPIPLFTFVAFSVYIVAFYPDYLVLSASPPVFPGTTFDSVGTLLSMHVVEAIINICILTQAGFEPEGKDQKKTLP